MTSATIGIASVEETNARTRRAFGDEVEGAFIGFQAMPGAGPLATRDIKSGHGDIHAMLQAGALERDGSGQVLFPSDEVHVYFILPAA